MSAGLPPSGVSRGKSVSLLFPASGGHLCSLTPGPFPVSAQLFASVVTSTPSFDLLFFFFFFQTVPGISCSTRELLASAFKLLVVTCEVWFSDQGPVPSPLQWERRVLATEPPGKSHLWLSHFPLLSSLVILFWAHLNSRGLSSLLKILNLISCAGSVLSNNLGRFWGLGCGHSAGRH